MIITNHLTEPIYHLMDTYHRGRSRAIPREKILEYLQQTVDPDATDRDMRKGYERLPMCECSGGLYFPGTPQEKSRQMSINIKKGSALFAKNKILAGYQVPAEPVQGRLF